MCTWLCRDNRLSVASLWDESTAWECTHSNESELWAAESDRNRELIDRAYAIHETAPETALRIFAEAAEGGSAWAMERVGWQYATGTGVAADADRALEYYHRAIGAGSWMATIGYARVLAAHGHYKQCEEVLEDGVRSAFVPAYFWLAWFRYEQSRTRKTCREVRPLLEFAAQQGHPGAALTLARFMAKGKFGVREIPEGVRRALGMASRFRSDSRDDTTLSQDITTRVAV